MMISAEYDEIGKCKITLKKAEKNISYPMIRLPSEYAHLAGAQAKIYRVDDNSYLVVIDNKKKLYNPEGILSKSSNSNDAIETPKKTKNQNGCGCWDEQSNVFASNTPARRSEADECGGWDLNPGTPTGLAPQASAFDHARQPPL